MTPSASDPKRLRVLFLAHYFPKPANQWMGNWAMQQALALQRNGVEVSVLSFSSWIPRLAGRAGVKPAWALCPREHDWNGLRVEYPRWPIYFNGPVWRWAYRNPRQAERLAWLSARPAMLRAVQRFGPNVIFAHHTLFNGCLARRLKQCTGIPYVLTEHLLAEISDCERYPNRRQVFAPVAEAASTWIAVGSRMQHIMERLFPQTRPITVHNGSEPIPDPMWIVPRPEAIRGRTVVFSAGVFYEQKGFPLLIRAFAKIAAKHPAAILRIAGGGGTDGPAIKRTLRECNLGPDRVHLVGLLTLEQVKQEMVWSDVFALAGWDEAFGVVFLEAASAGKPIIWSEDAGIADALRAGTHGMSMRPRDLESAADALDRLLADPDARLRMGQASRSLFEARFTWDANAVTMRGIFERAS